MLDLGILRELGEQTEDLRVRRLGLEVEDKAELEVHARNRTRLELREIHVDRGKLRDDRRECARLVRERERERDLVRVRKDLEILRDADEARVVEGRILNALGNDFEAVEVGAGPRGDDRRVAASRLGDLLRRERRVRAARRLDLGMGLEEVLALREGVRMARHLPDVLKLHALRREQDMVDLEPAGPRDVEGVLLHEVVDGRDRARRRILDRQDTVRAKALLDRLEDLFEIIEIGDRRHLHEPTRRLLGVRALRAAARDHRARGKRVGMSLARRLDRADQGRVPLEDIPLPRLGNREQRREEEPCGVLVRGPRRLGDLRQDLPFTRRHVDRPAHLLFRQRHFPRDVQTLEEKLHQLLVNRINLRPRSLKVKLSVFHDCRVL